MTEQTSTAPAVSVLMTVFNGHRYLNAAVDGILNQTFGDFEFVILDDGSQDESPGILQDYAKQDARIRVMTGPNRGLTKALNVGLKEVRGKYVARMDCDDVSLPRRLEKQVQFLDEHPEHVVVGSRCMLIDPEGYPICEKRDIVPTHEQIDRELMRLGWPIVHPSVMMRTDAVRRIGGYDERFRTNQDHDLFLRLAEIGRLENLSEILLLYRQHFESVGFTKGESQAHTVVEIVHEAHRRRGLPFPEYHPEMVQPLRPLEHRRNWSWWALRAGNLGTARRHAFALVRGAPLDKESWRAVYCALRGR